MVTSQTPESTDPGASRFRRDLGTWDLVLLNLVAVTSLRWLGSSAAAGPSSIGLWILAAVFFFVPMGLAVSEMAVRQPEQGGIYAWTKRSLGGRHGFLAGWCYWVNNMLYPASLLMSTAAVFTYAVGRGGTSLESSWPYVLSFTISLLAVATVLNVVGLRTGKWLQNFGAVATYLPGVLLIALGAHAMATRAPANDMSLPNLVPDLSSLSGVNLWASIAFAQSTSSPTHTERRIA